MSELKVVARIEIRPGKLDEFKSIATECMIRTREKDNGTLQYDWYFSPDESECLVFERYRDSEAVMEHMENLADTFEALLGTGEPTIYVVGDPSAELIAASEGLDVRILQPFQSLQRPPNT